jgi:hypothetical protein
VARDFDGATQYGRYTVDVPKNGFPVTLAVRFNPDGAAGFLALLQMVDGGGGEFLQLGTDGSSLRSIAATGFVEEQVYAANGMNVGAWNSAVAIFNSSTDRTTILNADFANQGTGTAASTPGTMTAVDLATYMGSGNFFDGKLAEAAIWGVALSNSDVQAYHDGKSPLHIQRRQLLGYWPLIGKFSPEIDIMNGRSFTLTGSPTAFEHPLIVMPGKRKLFFASAGNQTYTASISVTAPHNVSLVRSTSLNVTTRAPHSVFVIRLLQKTLSTFAAHVATVVAQLPTITNIAINVTAVVTATASATFQAVTRTFVGSAGLGVFIRSRRPWRRR